jgi:structural maintenance of chromosome 2
VALSYKVTLTDCSFSNEKQEKKVVKMHAQVLKDKKNIESTVARLVEHKRETLMATWEKVTV